MLNRIDVDSGAADDDDGDDECDDDDDGSSCDHQLSWDAVKWSETKCNISIGDQHQ